MQRTRVIANYLPQYHRIPENDAWWGDGYTDWVAVRKSTPLFEGHVQPRVPLGANYYSLDEVEPIKQQAKMAQAAGIYGFGIYHYWFSREMHLLDKPVELIRDNADIDIHYMLIWDNNSWKRTWSNVGSGFDWAPMYSGDAARYSEQPSGLLAELKYGREEEWRAHFDYLLPFFKDPRYVKIDEKPAFAFMVPHLQPATLAEMGAYWNQLAIDAGFKGIALMSKASLKATLYGGRMEYRFKYESLPPNTLDNSLKSIARKLAHVKKDGITFYDYDKEWRRILKSAKRTDASTYLSAIVDYDDTPRRGIHGSVMVNATPEKFECYLKELYKLSIDQEKSLLFVSAWNEWGEGMYLEPDEQNGYAYLEALKRAIESVEG